MNNTTETARDNIVQGAFRPSLLAKSIARVRVWLERRSAIRQLSAMPDDLLRDIGIERHQIKHAVMNSGRRSEVYRLSDERPRPAFVWKKAA